MAKTLHIAVNDKVATYCQRDGVIVCGNSDYEIAFSFDSEWDNHPAKTARFIHGKTYEDVVFEGNTVAVPIMRGVTSLSVGVFSGDLKTTTPALITCRKSILCDGGSPSAPTPDVYAQIMELLNQGGGGSVSVVQEAGDSETAVMSQKAATEAHNALSDRIRIAEEKIDDIETGESQVGTTPLFEVDEVVTLEAGERAYVDIDSSDPAKPRISFGIPQGADGIGKDGAYVTSVDEMGGDDTKTTYKMRFSDGTGYDFDVYNGKDGTNGKDGEDGKSAYEIYLANGGNLSEPDWLASLQGKDGTDGAKGGDGADGKSAYEIAVDEGFGGTEAEWLESLKGKDGINGKDGANGKDGSNGANGADGVGIKSIAKTSTSGLVDTYTITLTNNTTATFTVTNGKAGTNGTNGTNGNNGSDGKSAYAYAVEGGYEGTEEDFARQMAVEIVYNDSLNLFDINDPDVTRGYYLTGEGYQGGDVGCAITGYIPVEPNTKYTRSAGATIFHTIEYTKDKTVIGRVSATKTFATSANAAYVRATVIITQTPLETYMFVKGDTLPSVYIPYGNSLIIAGHNIPLGEEVEESDSATITKWGVIGDSLSNQEKWQTTACAILRLTGYEKNAITGAYVADYGDGGDASANSFVNRYLNTPEDCDLITIMGGTNDATYKCGDGIGEIGTLNTNTFIGAYCTIIEGLLDRNPAVRIMLFTPPRCYTAQGVLNPHLAVYVEAVKSIAAHYDLPCLDLYNNLGINDKTFDTLLPDYVHFSDALGYRVGRVIGNFVKNNY